jgi:hypothetical protein
MPSNSRGPLRHARLVCGTLPLWPVPPEPTASASPWAVVWQRGATLVADDMNDAAAVPRSSLRQGQVPASRAAARAESYTPARSRRRPPSSRRSPAPYAARYRNRCTSRDRALRAARPRPAPASARGCARWLGPCRRCREATPNSAALSQGRATATRLIRARGWMDGIEMRMAGSSQNRLIAWANQHAAPRTWRELQRDSCVNGPWWRALRPAPGDSTRTKAS